MKNDVMNDLEDRLNNLEMKVAFQEDTISQLSDEIVLLNELIDRQRTQLEYVASRLGEVSQGSQISNAPEPPPPHY